MALISKKKIVYKINPALRSYLVKYGREVKLPIDYEDLIRYDNSITLYDKAGRDTLWETVFYSPADMADVYYHLKVIYAALKTNGDLSVTQHLVVDRVDLCVYGNTRPFRIRVTNSINDNFDYFYIKKADASRVYGLELEHILSPNRISYITSGDTLVEEHIAGVPGDLFIQHYLHDRSLNKVRLAKEFVKFNERCFVRLLGDMHASNFVILITPDFEEVHYRIRAIDFDQQSYEGKKSVFLPQYFKQNNPILELGYNEITPESVKQYQKEEKVMIANRLNTAGNRIFAITDIMSEDTISTPENTERLKKELAAHYNNPDFLQCPTMGEIVKLSLRLVLKDGRI
ncbi:hypothetical protein Q0590_27225 [Rhodocytophaga aerolata]|uniref:Uncharacterized protein n=1 Tax=Rhodocytophaga aerolata TaxID=455078 RepID=A0ABT8RD19_9BACT|nr:hypothetical protein [Rhodocytophaga aerolata]MDO1450002.1 hypothetical protein [Rhodocytophaga aerolata]